MGSLIGRFLVTYRKYNKFSYFSSLVVVDTFLIRTLSQTSLFIDINSPIPSQSVLIVIASSHNS